MPDGTSAPRASEPPSSHGASAEENVRADDALLRRGQPAARVAVLSDRSLSVGAGVRPDVSYVLRARSEGRAIVRRGSGGTAVVHAPGDLAWSVVLPRSDPRVGRDFVRAYERLGAGVVRFLEEERLPARWTPAPGLSEGLCLLSGRGRVLSVHGRVVGGAAQHLAGPALLHHGILTRSLDRAALARWFDLPGPVLERLTSLEELGLVEPSEALAARLERALSRAVGTG